MSCGDVTERQPFQELLAELNPKMVAYVAALPEDAARSGQLDREMPESVSLLMCHHTWLCWTRSSSRAEAFV